MRTLCLLILACYVILPGTVSAEEPVPLCPDQLLSAQETIQKLTTENTLLQEKLARPLPPSITATDLNTRIALRLREIAADVKGQRQSMNEFQGYITWMSGSIAGYSKYIEAGSIAAGFARVLPIPYAGQAGMFTKFVSHFTLSLSAASRSITAFLATAQQFTNRVDALDTHPDKGRETGELLRFAEEQLVRDMTDLQAKLSTTSELSTSALSFMESVNSYAQSSDEYWTKAKSLVRKGDAEKKEKGFLADSVTGLKNKAGGFNARLRGYDDSVRKDIPLIKSLGTYAELLAYLTWRQAEEGGLPQPSPTVPQPVPTKPSQ
jgi:hypothetical protein